MNQEFQERKEKWDKKMKMMMKTYTKNNLIGMLIMLAERLDNKVSTEPDCPHALTVEMFTGCLRETARFSQKPEVIKEIVEIFFPNWVNGIIQTRRKKGI